jgi:glycosyltransferase involved in cell wall biosynthesis
VCWNEQLLADWQAMWGDRSRQVVITGAIKRSELAAVLGRADAAVLPSHVDNLPNTVIESLSSGIPVIGTNGASIDEIVEDGVTGHLVPFGDKLALAAAMVEVWTGRSAVVKGFTWQGSLRNEMSPQYAAEQLLAIADSTSAPNRSYAGS